MKNSEIITSVLALAGLGLLIGSQYAKRQPASTVKNMQIAGGTMLGIALIGLTYTKFAIAK